MRGPSASGAAPAGPVLRWLAGAALVLPALAIVRLALGRFYQMDEFVFVRCAWLVGGGAFPYRDFFDHHTPLFYMLLSPLMALAPESPAAMSWARVATLVVLAAVVAVTARIGWRLGGPAGSWLTAILLLTFSGFVARAIEVRPDLLATLAFAGCAALLLAEPAPGRWRAGAVGALTAIAMLSNQKALYYLWGLAALGVADLVAGLRRRTGPRSLGRPWAALGGSLLPLALFAAVLGLAGALPAFWRQNVELAIRWQATELTFSAWRYLAPLLAQSPHWFLLVAIGGLALLLDPASRAGTTPRQRRVYLALALPAGISLAVNPIPWPYNFLPVFAILAPLSAPVPGLVAARLGARGGRAATAAVGLLALLVFAVQTRAELSRHNREQRSELARILALTQPDEAVFDTNGGYLFRPAATWYWYHSAAMRELQQDRFAASLEGEIRTSQAAAWIADQRFRYLPAGVRDFLRASYQRHSGSLFFWGSAYRSPASGGRQSFEFATIRPGRYFLEPADAAAWTGTRVTVAGSPIEPRVAFVLDRGTHEVIVERPTADRPLDFHLLWLPADRRPWRPLPGPPPPYYPYAF